MVQITEGDERVILLGDGTQPENTDTQATEAERDETGIDDENTMAAVAEALLLKSVTPEAAHKIGAEVSVSDRKDRTNGVKTQWQPVSKAPQTQRKNAKHQASCDMISRAAAALAGVFAMMILLLSTQLPQSTIRIMKELTAPAYDVAFAAQAAPSAYEEPQPTPNSTELTIRLADVDSDVAEEIRIQLMGVTAELIDSKGGIDLSGSEPKVLIYHTHDTEAYTQTEQNKYTPSGDWRTYDNTRNVIAVGEELARLLRDEYGIAVIHDTTPHEPPKLTDAYTRSCATMEYYKRQYPSLEMYIDLHRDAYTVDGVNTDYAVINGEQVARMMFVVGTGKGATGSGTEPLPDFESNYALAMNLTETLLSYHPKLARNVRVKSGRYNQHISSKCILVEVGHNANTLEEAFAAMPYLAKAIAEVAGISTAAQPLTLIP